MKVVKFTNAVGVAPGTITMQLGRMRVDEPRGCCDGGSAPDDCCSPFTAARAIRGLGRSLGYTSPGPGMWPPPEQNPYPFPEESRFYLFDPWARYGRGSTELADVPAPRIRWDIIGVIGGGSLAIALAIGLVASALSK